MLMSRAPPCSAGDLSTVVDTSLVTIPRSDSFTAPAEGGWSRRHGLRVIGRIVELVRIAVCGVAHHQSDALLCMRRGKGAHQHQPRGCDQAAARIILAPPGKLV